MRSFNFQYALLPDGLVRGCRVDVDDAGVIQAIQQGTQAPYDGALALPGMPNAHSHAFQRALLGHGESRAGDDSFWSWREAMYALAGSLDAERMYALAQRAYGEMLAAGFTAVAEFHYLHHLPDGSATTDMADAVIAAARETGIRLRLLPVLYMTGGFGKPASAAQRRFVHASVDDYLELLGRIGHPYTGVAIHSLRAVPLDAVVQLVRSTTEQHVVHIHISEQETEVADCLAMHGKRPVDLLLDTCGVDARWTLVHATHADAAERRRVVDSGACVALCPLTEAYLGDGLFAATDYIADGGVFSIGSDSNVRIDAIEELRWLEYGQRLRDRKRARLATAQGIGAPLWAAAARGGARSTGFACGEIAVGKFADFVVLDGEAAPFADLDAARWLDAWLVGGTRSDIATVYVGGVPR